MSSQPIKKLQNKPISYAFCINAAFALACLLFFYNNYETNDDQLMLMLLTGSFSGTGTHYIMYVNSVLSFPIQVLYKTIPTIPWYPIIQYATVFISLTAITYLLIRKDTMRGTILSLLLLCSFGFDFYTRMQFTKVSGVATSGGIALCVYVFSSQNKKVLKIILSILLVLVGSCFRFKMSLAVIAMLTPLILFYTVDTQKSQTSKKLLPALVCLILIVACLVPHYINQQIYSENEGWAKYMEFNASRSQLLDRSFPRYTDHEEFYQSIEITQSDIDLYKTWDFGDPKVFSSENVQRMADIRTSPTINSSFLKSSMSVLWGYRKYPWFPTFVIGCILVIYASRKNIIWTLLQALAITSFSLFLFYNQRYLQNRVDICVFFASTLTLFIIFLDTCESRPLPFNKALIIAICLSCIVFIPGYTKYTNKTLNANIQSAQHRRIAEFIANDTSHLYLVSLRSSGIWQDAYGLFEPLKPNSMSNICFLGGCFAFTPEWDKTLKRWEIENPYTDCINNENIYVLDNTHIDLIIAYINRHYDENAKAVPVNIMEDCAVYQIISDSP